LGIFPRKLFYRHVYPVNFAFIDGRMSEELYREVHELDLAQTNARGQSEASGPQPKKSADPVS
jgi:hypothetical protein